VPHQFGIHGILEDQSHVMTRIREEVSTRMSKSEETGMLHLRPGVTRFVMHGDMTGLQYDVRAE